MYLKHHNMSEPSTKDTSKANPGRMSTKLRMKLDSQNQSNNPQIKLVRICRLKNLTFNLPSQFRQANKLLILPLKTPSTIKTNHAREGKINT